MDPGATATIVGAIVAGAVTLIIAFQKSAMAQWQTLSKARKGGIGLFIGLVAGGLITLVSPSLSVELELICIFVAAVFALALFVGKSPPQSN
jgi:uncharacterized membrane protein YccC